MNLSKYMRPTSRRSDILGKQGGFRGGKLVPVAIHPFGMGEGGIAHTNCSIKLEPIAGDLLTPITAEVIQVFVPNRAIHALKYDDTDLPGNEDVIRNELTAGSILFDLEGESEISRRIGIVPIQVDGQKYTNEASRLAYICAVNHLRLLKYDKAALLDSAHDGLAPALFSQTILDRLGGVLDPEDRVNGAVNLRGEIPIKGLGVHTSSTTSPNLVVRESGGQATYPHAYDAPQLRVAAVGPNGQPAVVADLSDRATDITLQDFYEAEMMHDLTMQMKAIVKSHPQHGEALLSRWAHGLKTDFGADPYVMYRREVQFNDTVVRGMDGPSLDITRTFNQVTINTTIPVPSSEFGGILLTLIAVKPDETIPYQPHPFFSKPFKAVNYAADELKLDPVPVLMREINANCATGDETTVVMYTGHNQLNRSYMNYGFNGFIDPQDVAEKSSIWQIEMPNSVTPQNINYPDDVDHYPFANQLGDVAIYQCEWSTRARTPLIFGPAVTEKMDSIDDEDIFEDQE